MTESENSSLDFSHDLSTSLPIPTTPALPPLFSTTSLPPLFSSPLSPILTSPFPSPPVLSPCLNLTPSLTAAIAHAQAYSDTPIRPQPPTPRTTTKQEETEEKKEKRGRKRHHSPPPPGSPIPPSALRSAASPSPSPSRHAHFATPRRSPRRTTPAASSPSLRDTPTILSVSPSPVPSLSPSAPLSSPASASSTTSIRITVESSFHSETSEYVVPSTPAAPEEPQSDSASIQNEEETENDAESAGSSDLDLSYSSSLHVSKRRNVIARTLSLGKGVMDLIFYRPLAFINAPSLEIRIAALKEGETVRLDDVISIERMDDAEEYTLPPLATMAQLLAPCTRLFRDVTSPGLYQLHISDPGLLQKFRNGVIGGTRTEGLLLDLSEGERYVGSAKLIASMTDVVTSVFQVASFAVSQNHLNAITRSLDEIASMLNKIGDKQIEPRIRVFTQEAEELAEFLKVLASAPATDVQRIDFDTRVGRLRMEARIALEEAFETIEEHKVKFKQTLQRKETIDKEELGKAANIFSQLCLCVKLSILLANLLHQRDIINGNDANYIQLSSKNLLTTLEKSHRLHETLQMFSPALLRKHGMFAWVKSFFYVEQPKLLHAMRRWKRGMEEEVREEGGGAGAGVSVLVWYDPAGGTLQLAEGGSNI